MEQRLNDEVVVEQLLKLLGNVATRHLVAIFDEVLERRRRAEGGEPREPVADPSIYLLYRWGILSHRTTFGLACMLRKSMQEIAEGYPRLSDIAQIPAPRLLAMPNFGRASFGEIALVLDDYGWALYGNGGLFKLPEREAKVLREQHARQAAKRDEAESYYRALLQEKTANNLSWKDLAERHGRTAQSLKQRIQEWENLEQFRALNPLPSPMK